MSTETTYKSRLSIRELCLLSLMGALMFALQLAMASLPNIHVTATLIILCAVFFGWKSLYSVAIFVMLEAFVWGFGLWWLCYWYLWPLLALVAIFMRSNNSALIWAVVAAAHGLCFGALCCIPYLFIGGTAMAFSVWISGIPFDLAHCAGNFVLTLILYRPLCSGMKRVLNRK